MAQRVIISNVSDLSGADIIDNNAPTVSFSWDGTDYSVDLTAKEAAKFYKAVAPYIKAGSKVSKSKRSGANKVPADGPSAKEVRAWAVDSGYEVPERGRIPADVREAYDNAAH